MGSSWRGGRTGATIAAAITILRPNHDIAAAMPQMGGWRGKRKPIFYFAD
jgi:hypothetical protein